jgi:hypothetical protein
MLQQREHAPIRIVIDVDAESDPIEGRLLEPGHHASSFRGWLALTTLIEAIRTPTSLGDDPRA